MGSKFLSFEEIEEFLQNPGSHLDSEGDGLTKMNIIDFMKNENDKHLTQDYVKNVEPAKTSGSGEPLKRQRLFNQYWY